MTSVVIGIPCFDQVYTDFAVSLALLMAQPRNGLKCHLMEVRGSDIVSARNLICDYALQSSASHVLFLDSDMKFPPDTLTRLLSHGKPVVGATYIRRCHPYDLLGHIREGNGVVEADELPTGCLLINTWVLKKLKWPWFYFTYDKTTRVGEDINFSRDVKKAGVGLWCDTELTKELCHIGIKEYTYKKEQNEV